MDPSPLLRADGKLTDVKGDQDYFKARFSFAFSTQENGIHVLKVKANIVRRDLSLR